MEHEVFVPVPAETLRQTLRDSARVARCVPGLQQDADASAGPLSGRLRVRIGGHTITYRGTLTLDEGDGTFAAEGEGTEARGTGSAKLTLTVRLTEAEGGTTLAFTGGLRAQGRLAELGAPVTTAAAHRLLDRFAGRLAEESAAPAGAGEPVPGATPEVPGPAPAAEGERASATGRGGDADLTDADLTDADFVDADLTGGGDAVDAARDDADIDDDIDAGAETGDGADEGGRRAPGGDPDASLFEGEPPHPPLEGETASVEGDFLIPDEPPDLPDDEPPAEAAHARRSMIGRSAEEVDHAPPRGRYAPVPAPEVNGAGATLRWIAPAAALAIASAVVVGRALRRRR